MTPDGPGGATGQGAGDVHPVGGFQEDDLGSHPLVVGQPPEAATGMVSPWRSAWSETIQPPLPTGKVSALPGSMRLICQPSARGATSTDVRNVVIGRAPRAAGRQGRPLLQAAPQQLTGRGRP